MKKEQPKNEKELKEALSRVWNGIEKGLFEKTDLLSTKSFE